MRLTPADIAWLAAEVAETGYGARVQRVSDQRTGEVLVQLRTPPPAGRTHHLLMAVGRNRSRLHLAEQRGPRPPAPTPFVSLLRKHLMGAALVEVAAPQGDCVVSLDFAHGAPDAEIEVTPRRPAQNEGDIDQAGLQAGEGDDHEAPASLESEAGSDLEEVGVTAGASDDDETGASLESGAFFRLVAELTGNMANIYLVDAEGRVLGSLFPPRAGRQRPLGVGRPYLYPPPPPAAIAEATPLLADIPHGQRSGRLESLLADLLGTSDLEDTRQELLRQVQASLKRNQARLESVQRDWGRARDADQLRRWGELLQTAHGRVAKGSTAARVVDYYSEDMPEVEVPLDPARSLAQNIAHYFKEGRRMAAARQRIDARLAETQGAITALEAGQRAIVGAANGDVLEQLAYELGQAGLLPRRRAPQPPPSKAVEAQPYREFTSKSGRPILVGRNARHNDTLTFRVARGRDVWLHVDGAGGAHVVLRQEKRAPDDPEAMLDAATLAAHFSKRKTDDVIDVRVARACDLRKPKGAPAGLVHVVRSRMVVLRMEAARLTRLLQSEKVAG